MTYGPCGGVRADGGCEMESRPCTFVDLVGAEPASWAETVPRPVRVPQILTDLSVPASDAPTLTATARRLAPHCDALLVGDHQDRHDFAPSRLARLIADAGGTPWVTLACRDRDHAALDHELRALRHDDLATVLCVTGDGRAFDVSPDIPQVFDLDGTRLAALAASYGLPVAVPETPTAPPVDVRPFRTVQKQRAGAGVVVLNHVGGADAVARFVTAARAAGLTVPVVASVAVFTDAGSAAALDALPGLELDPARVAAVVGAPDPVGSGIDHAVAEARALLQIDGVSGVNLSGLVSQQGVAAAAEIQAEIGRRIRAELVTATTG